MKLFHAWLGPAAAVLAVTAPPAFAGPLVINEIMADNNAALIHGGRYPDWIELYNNSDQAMSISGMRLSDDIAVLDKYVFPPATFIGARERLVVWCDSHLEIPGLHGGFKLSAQGANLSLYSADATPVLLDSITFGLQAADFSVGRVPDGTGAWQLTQPTAGGPNVAQALGSPAKLKINEWMASSSSGPDWLELYNADASPVSLGGLFLSADLTLPANTQLPALSFIGPKGFRQFIADKDLAKGADHVNFKLSAGGGSIGLFTAALQPLDTIGFGTQTTDISQGRLPDGVATIVGFFTTASPGDANYLPLTGVVFNELLTHTDPPVEDAIELLNTTDAPLDLSGWFISDSKSDLQRFRIPNGTTLPARGFRVFYEYQFNPNPGTPPSFTLNSAHGGKVYLAQADGAGRLTGYLVSQKFDAAENGVSLGRYVTSTGVDFTALQERTFGADAAIDLAQFRLGTGRANAAPRISPVVISEIMYQPPDLVVGGVSTDNKEAEFIKLQNTTGARVLLFDPSHRTNTWQLANAVEFTFPQNAYIDPYATVLVVGFDPVTNTTALAAFRETYHLPSAITPFGPWDGRLKNSGDTIELLKPDEPQISPHPDAGYVPYILVDKVKYSDVIPWPTTASGTGASLQRRDPRAYGNDAANWLADAPVPGQASGPLTIQSVQLLGNGLGIQFQGAAGRSYTVQSRSSLTSGSWLKLKDVFVTVTGLQTATDTLSPGASARFYRLVTPVTIP